MQLLCENLLSDFITAGLVQPTEGFVDAQPPEPKRSCVVYDNGSDELSLVGNLVHRYVFIACRDILQSSAKAFAYSIYNYLCQRVASEDNRYDIGGVCCQVYIETTPLKLEAEIADTVMYGFNLGITTEI